MKSFDVVLIINREKFTPSHLCESPCDLGAMLAFYFWIFLTLQIKCSCSEGGPSGVFLHCGANCNRSPYLLVHRSYNSTLLGPFLHLPPFKYTLYNALCLKA
jgi:hypothetical protein